MFFISLEIISIFYSEVIKIDHSIKSQKESKLGVILTKKKLN